MIPSFQDRSAELGHYFRKILPGLDGDRGDLLGALLNCALLGDLPWDYWLSLNHTTELEPGQARGPYPSWLRPGPSPRISDIILLRYSES